MKAAIMESRNDRRGEQTLVSVQPQVACEASQSHAGHHFLLMLSNSHLSVDCTALLEWPNVPLQV